MALVLTTLDRLISDQARATETSDVPVIEHVAAKLRRVTGFINIGTGASGHSVSVDEPTAFGGGGTAADPAELLLIAVGASLSVTVTVHASLAAVPIDAINVVLSGSLDAGRFFVPSEHPGAGFAGLEIGVEIASSAEPAEVRQVLDRSLLASPVLRSLSVSPAVTLTINGLAA